MTNLNGVKLVRAGREDAQDLLALINYIQPHVPWDEEQLHWQFFAPPAGAARLWALRDGSAIVSLYAAIPQRIRSKSEIHRGWMIQDVMSHPDYRGRGFLHHLGQLCFDEIKAEGDAGYTFPNKLSEGSFRRIGWDEAMLVPARTGAVNRVQVHGTPITKLDAFGSVQTSIWQTADAGTGVERDADFLEWRYQKPGQRYERFAIASDQGYLVLKFFENAETKTLHICDLVVRPGARELVANALSFAHAHALSKGATRITAWLPETHPDAPAYLDAGLAMNADRDRFMFTTGPATGPRWHLTQGDSDVY